MGSASLSDQIMRVRLPAGLAGFATLATTFAATTAATATATEATATAATETATAAAFFARLRLRLIHAQRATVQLLAVQGVDRRLGLGAVRHLDEAETLGAARHAVGNDARGSNLAVCGKRVPQGLIIRRIGKIANIDVHVSVLLYFTHAMFVQCPAEPAPMAKTDPVGNLPILRGSQM